MTLREELQEKTKKAQTDPWETAHMKKFATFLKSKCFKAAEEGKSRICFLYYSDHLHWKMCRNLQNEMT